VSDSVLNADRSRIPEAGCFESLTTPRWTFCGVAVAMTRLVPIRTWRCWPTQETRARSSDCGSQPADLHASSGGPAQCCDPARCARLLHTGGCRRHGWQYSGRKGRPPTRSPTPSRVAREPDDLPPPVLAEPERSRLLTYVERFNARDFDAIRNMLADDVRLDLVNRLRGNGRGEVGGYFHKYSLVDDWHFVPGFVAECAGSPARSDRTCTCPCHPFPVPPSAYRAHDRLGPGGRLRRLVQCSSPLTAPG
jgi:hypothetical protein